MNRISLLLTLLLLGGALAGCADTDEGTPTPTPTTATPSPTPTTSTPVVTLPTPPTTPTPAGNLTNQTSPGIYVLAMPASLTAGQNATICWHVNGTGRIPHTALHFDNESHPNSTRFQDYDGGAIYPENKTSADTAGYAVPGDFCANLMVPETGTLYFRAHALVPNIRNELSDEHEITGGAGSGS